MSGQRILLTDNDARESLNFINNRISALRGLVDSEIIRCKLVKEALALIKKAPAFLEIFSAEEIIDINQRERKILEVVKFLQKLKQSIHLKNFQFVANGTIIKGIKEVDKGLKEFQDFIEVKRSKLPKPKLAILLLWICAPHFCVTCLVKKCVYKIKMRRLEKIKKDILKE